MRPSGHRAKLHAGIQSSSNAQRDRLNTLCSGVLPTCLAARGHTTRKAGGWHGALELACLCPRTCRCSALPIWSLRMKAAHWHELDLWYPSQQIRTRDAAPGMRRMRIRTNSSCSCRSGAQHEAASIGELTLPHLASERERLSLRRTCTW